MGVWAVAVGKTECVGFTQSSLTMYLLPSSDIARVQAIALQRLTNLFPILQAAELTIAADVLLIDCYQSADVEKIAGDDFLMHLIYLTTGCSAASVCLSGVPILSRTQLRLIQISEGAEMAKTLQRAATAEVLTLADGQVDKLAAAIAQAIMSVLDTGSEAKMIPVEPTPPTPPAQTIAPIRIPRGAFTPAKSNWMQSATRYLKAVDPGGDGSEILAAIVAKTPLGDAHLNKALSYLPKAEREAAREKFYQGFVKVAEKREKA